VLQGFDNFGVGEGQEEEILIVDDFLALNNFEELSSEEYIVNYTTYSSTIS
jgi:hypothetical protein